MIYFVFMPKLKTIRFNAYNTRRNLPADTGRKRGESNFLGAFERYLLSSVYTCGVGGRYFPLSNYGMADFVWLLPAERKANATQGYLHSFETKLHDWRRAFQQAYRYSYFSDASFVVLPPTLGAVAEKYLSLFQTHSIGLWTFDPQANKLNRVFTPEASAPRNAEAKKKAVQVIASRGNLL
jgi:hypothetical protein